MFRHCCDHATFVAPRQPFRDLMEALIKHGRRLEYLGVPILPCRTQPDSDRSDDCSSLAGAWNQRARTAGESRLRAERCDSPGVVDDRPPDDRADSRTLRRPTSNVLGGQSRHFCATCTFCARFRHATTPPPSRSAQRDLFTPRISRDRTMPYANYRMLFVRRRNAADALMRRSNVRLTRHRSAPAPRKTAARLSSPGPLLLFFLAGG